jgi:hypothetical protein
VRAPTVGEAVRHRATAILVHSIVTTARPRPSPGGSWNQGREGFWRRDISIGHRRSLDPRVARDEWLAERVRSPHVDTRASRNINRHIGPMRNRQPTVSWMCDMDGVLVNGGVAVPGADRRS